MADKRTDAEVTAASCGVSVEQAAIMHEALVKLGSWRKIYSFRCTLTHCNYCDHDDTLLCSNSVFPSWMVTGGSHPNLVVLQCSCFETAPEFDGLYERLTIPQSWNSLPRSEKNNA